MRLSYNTKDPYPATTTTTTGTTTTTTTGTTTKTITNQPYKTIRPIQILTTQTMRLSYNTKIETVKNEIRIELISRY